MRRTMFKGLVLIVGAATLAGAQKRAITFDDFISVRAVSDPQMSPNGQTILYSVRIADLAGNKRTGRTYVTSSTAANAKQFPSADVNASEARWSPDGQRVAYVAGGQLWVSAADGSSPKQLTSLNG